MTDLALVPPERRVARSRPGPVRAALALVGMATGAYLLGGVAWGVVGLLAAALLVWAARYRFGRTYLPSHGGTDHPEFRWGLVAAFVAAGAYLYGGWRWGVVGLLAAALLAWRRRVRQAGSSLSPVENGRADSGSRPV